jgi:diguanylate cyclase (GGDEF)-like protein
MATLHRSRVPRRERRPGRDPWHGLDLSAALRILHHAGKPDPTQSDADSQAQLQCIIDTLCDLSIHDGLTGLVNATFFHLALAREVDRSHRTGRNCGLLLIDLDHFKHVNDTYGHAAGDLVLQAFAERLRHSLRGMDTAARTGGEEFAVILPECSPECAIRAAGRIYAALNPLTVRVGAVVLTVTMSAGLVWTEVQSGGGSAALVAMADEELYRAKKWGRNRMCHPAVGTTQVTCDERSLLFAAIREGDDGP